MPLPKVRPRPSQTHLVHCQRHLLPPQQRCTPLDRHTTKGPWRNSDLELIPVTSVEELAIGHVNAPTLRDTSISNQELLLAEKIPLAGLEQYHLVEDVGLQLSPCELATIGQSLVQTPWRDNLEAEGPKRKTPVCMVKRRIHLEDEVPVNNSNLRGPNRAVLHQQGGQILNLDKGDHHLDPHHVDNDKIQDNTDECISWTRNLWKKKTWRKKLTRKTRSLSPIRDAWTPWGKRPWL